jgi:hypothetical protein
MSREQNRWANALSRPDGAEKVSAKVGVILPDRMFTQFLSRTEDDEEADLQDRSREVADSCNRPSAGHLGVKRMLELLIR